MVTIVGQFSENLIRRVFIGAAKDTAQGSVDFVNYLGDKWFDERPFEDEFRKNT